MKAGRYRVRIRRDIGMEVKPEAEALDGKVFNFRPTFTMEEGERYPGEVAMMFDDPDAPRVLTWIASGDLEPTEDTTERRE